MKKVVSIINVVASFSLGSLIFLSSFCFGKLVKIPQNDSALQSYLLKNNTEYDNMLL